MTYIMSCVWLDYMVKYFQCKNCVGSSPKTKKCVASFLVPGDKIKSRCGPAFYFYLKGFYNMINNEANLLYSVLLYEEGHVRRTQHILKVYSLSKLLGERENIPEEEQTILQAAAILHDIAIKYCKEHYNGDAGQDKQKREAPHLVQNFLKQSDYSPSYIPKITELVISHHDYDKPRNKLLQLLIEADLIVNCYESHPTPEKIEYIRRIFQTETGSKLLELCLKSIT